MRIGAQECFLRKIGNVGRSAHAGANEARNSTFVTVEKHGKQFAVSAADKAYKSLVALLPDRHPPCVRLLEVCYCAQPCEVTRPCHPEGRPERRRARHGAQ